MSSIQRWDRQKVERPGEQIGRKERTAPDGCTLFHPHCPDGGQEAIHARPGGSEQKGLPPSERLFPCPHTETGHGHFDDGKTPEQEQIDEDMTHFVEDGGAQADAQEAAGIEPEQQIQRPAEQQRVTERQRPQPDAGAVGKLVTDATWYFVCAMGEEEAGRLIEGRTVTVRFSRDWSGEVDMKVERVGETPENGRVTVVLSSDRYLSETTLLRKQTVELVFDSQTGIRVPTQAVRVEERTVTDPETEEEKQELVTGVYVLVGQQAEFKPVTILAQLEDFALVKSADGSDGKKALRAGDEVILSSVELFDGKVITQS